MGSSPPASEGLSSSLCTHGAHRPRHLPLRSPNASLRHIRLPPHRAPSGAGPLLSSLPITPPTGSSGPCPPPQKGAADQQPQRDRARQAESQPPPPAPRQAYGTRVCMHASPGGHVCASASPVCTRRWLPRPALSTPPKGSSPSPPTSPSPTCSQSPEQHPRADRAPRNQAPPLAFAPAQPTPLTRSFPSPVPPSCLRSDSGALHLPASHCLPLLPSPLPLTGLPPAACGPQESRLTPKVPACRGAGRQPGTAAPLLLLPPGGGTPALSPPDLHFCGDLCHKCSSHLKPPGQFPRTPQSSLAPIVSVPPREEGGSRPRAPHRPLDLLPRALPPG